MKPLSINQKREIRIGLMAIIAIGLLFFGINYLKGVNIFSPTNYYIAIYKNVDGLVPANAVTIQGYKIGQVHKIKYNFSKDSAFQVYISINKDIKLPKGTYAELKDAGLMGGKSIELVFPKNSESYYKSGDIIPSSMEEGFMAILNKKVMPKIEELLPKVDSLVDALHSVASDPSIGKSLASIERTTNNLDQTSNQLKTLMNHDVPNILTKVNVMADNFDAVSNNLRDINFAATIASVNKTLANVQSITEKINSHNGTLGLLLNDTTLYVSLSHLTQNTNTLMVDLKAHPKRYVHLSLIDFSKK
jgi:phospholipid/cholesterol/gamma-HCH transport system substrate-binding protein